MSFVRDHGKSHMVTRFALSFIYFHIPQTSGFLCLSSKAGNTHSIIQTSRNSCSLVLINDAGGFVIVRLIIDGIYVLHGREAY